MKESPIACEMSALDASQRERHRLLLAQFRSSVQEMRALSDGYAFSLPVTDEMIGMVAEWIALERLCCPFLRFELVVGPETHPLELRLTGREGVKEFIMAELGITEALANRRSVEV